MIVLLMLASVEAMLTLFSSLNCLWIELLLLCSRLGTFSTGLCFSFMDPVDLMTDSLARRSEGPLELLFSLCCLPGEWLGVLFRLLSDLPVFLIQGS